MVSGKYTKDWLPLAGLLFVCLSCASPPGAAPAPGMMEEVQPGQETLPLAGESAQQTRAAETAAPITYSLADTGLSLTLPGDLGAITRTEIRNQHIFETARLDPQSIRSFMRENRASLYALDQAMAQEILLVSYPNTSRDYQLLTDNELMAISASSEMGQILAGLGTNSSVYGFFRSGNAAWIIIDIQQAGRGQIIYASEYYTVRNGRAITLTLQSSGGPLSAAQYALLKGIAESIVFTP